MKVAVIMFPGSGAASDAIYAYRNVIGAEVWTVWHQEENLGNPDLVVIPGGAAFGDYLRPGALTRGSAIVGSLVKYARDDRPVIGIGNGFQILCELEILPGILLHNISSRFLNTDTFVLADNTRSIWTKTILPDDVLCLPMSCNYGRYYADKRTLKDLEEEGHIAFRFCNAEGEVDEEHTFNGSLNNIAGILNRHENVLGIIQHPERAVEKYMGSIDGLNILSSIFEGKEIKKVVQDPDESIEQKNNDFEEVFDPFTGMDED